MRPGAGTGTRAGIILLINIFCSQFRRCKDEEKLISTSIVMVLLIKKSFKCNIWLELELEPEPK